MSHGRVRQRGHVMLETALVFTAFSFLLLGTFDFAQFLFVHSTLADRARTAARWGAALEQADVGAIRNMVFYGTPAEQVGSVPHYHLAPEHVQVRIRDAGTEEARLEVRIVNYPYRVISPWISGMYTAQPIVAAVPLGPDR